MHYHRLAVRPVCSAQNAFDVSHAIRRAFADGLKHAHLSDLQSRTSQPLRRFEPSASSAITPIQQRDGQAALQENTGRRRIGTGGTFANYEALTSARDPAKRYAADNAGNGRESGQTPMARSSSYHPAAPQIEYDLSGDQSRRAARPTKKERIWRPQIDGMPEPSIYDTPVGEIRPPQPTERIWRPQIENMPEPTATHTPFGIQSKLIIRPAVALTEEQKQRGDGGIQAKELRVSEWKAHMVQLAEEAGDLAKIPVKLTDHTFIRKAKRKLVYLGKSIPTPSTSVVDKLEFPWALFGAERTGKSAMDALALEMKHFVEYMEPTKAEKAAREAVIADTRAVIAEAMGPEVQSEIFGSEKTGLATALSDIDIRLSYIEVKGDGDPRNLSSRMKPLFHTLKELNDDFFCVVYRNSRFPIINAQHKRTGIDIQIVSPRLTPKPSRI